MALLNNPQAMPSQAPADSTTTNENIYTAQKALGAPKKVSSRPVEPVPVKFDEEEANKMASFAKSNAASGSVSSNSLVQNQLNNVLAAGGPLLKRARADGMSAAAERGLNNTSMGVQAGEEAVVRQALQIATPDAQTYGEMDRANLASASAMAQMGVNQAYTDYNQRKQNAFVAAENNADRNQKDDLFDRGNEFAEQQQTKQNLFSSGEANLDRTWKSSEQDKQNLFSSGEANLDRTWKSSEQDKQNEFAGQQQRAQNDFSYTQMAREHSFRLNEIKANADEQIRASASQVDQKFQAQYLDAATNLQRGFLDMQTAILNNSQGKSSAQVNNAMNIARQQFDSSVAWLQGVYKQGGTKINTSAFASPGASSASTDAVTDYLSANGKDKNKVLQELAKQSAGSNDPQVDIKIMTGKRTMGTVKLSQPLVEQYLGGETVVQLGAGADDVNFNDSTSQKWESMGEKAGFGGDTYLMGLTNRDRFNPSSLATNPLGLSKKGIEKITPNDPLRKLVKKDPVKKLIKKLF